MLKELIFLQYIFGANSTPIAKINIYTQLHNLKKKLIF